MFDWIRSLFICLVLTDVELLLCPAVTLSKNDITCFLE